MLACVVCAGGYTLCAGAQAAPVQDLCHNAPQPETPAADLSAPGTGTAFVEHADDDDVVDLEPPTPLRQPRLPSARWQCASAPALRCTAQVSAGHHALEPRPPR